MSLFLKGLHVQYVIHYKYCNTCITCTVLCFIEGLHVQYVIDCRYCNTCITNSVSGACTEPGLRLTVTNLYLCSHGEVRGRRISGRCVQQGGWVPRGTTGPTVQEWEPDGGDQDLPGQRRKTHHCKSRCKGHKCLYIYRLAVNSCVAVSLVSL